MSELPKTFDPGAIEARWYSYWESKGLFRPERPDAEPFTIVIPPPNVTGSLHIGHALDNTLQDILVRHARLKGKDALWVVGTDHAGIATQMVVERNLASQGIKRTDMSREAFVEHVWEWKAQSGGAITRQLRRLGASCDWANERFTMDEGFSRAVVKVFVQLYREGLLYRDKRLVNWDPKFGTAISDLEVESREVDGHMWHFRYPLEDGSGFIAIATTRPETILGDGAVAVNPSDERYKHLVGKKCKLPIVDRLIPIIADDYVEKDFGSGAVKITAAHDHNDYEVYKRHPDVGIPLINLMTADARMNENTPPDYRGLDRYEARKKVIADFEALGLLDKIEPLKHNVPFGDRSGVVIEPWLTDQWYVDAKTLAGPAIEAVRSGTIKVVPESWTKTYYNWMENIQPWCVSRQLWWGHQIPAWFADDGRVFVAESEEEAQAEAGEGVLLRRDDDVLDTWFSSALWPFGTLGWPDSSPLPLAGGAGGGPDLTGAQGDDDPTPSPSRKREGNLLARHYPNDVLISGFDILFFWDARMIMQGLHFMKEVPFKTLYLHGLVRAADGSKMAKSKGNTVDPLGLIDKFGADALRFTMAAMESQGRDVKLDERRVEGYRNFATKLWNAARFAQANGIGASTSLEAPNAQLAVNRWIIGETIRTVQKLDLALADLRYDEAANTIYQFVWASFCDWYLELIKPVLGGGNKAEASTNPDLAEPVEAPPSSLDEEKKEGLRQAQASRGGDDASARETRAVAGWVLDQILVMLHPFMPFITEELWHAMGERPYELIVAKWPIADARAIDPDAGREIDWLIRLVSEIRAARTEVGIPPGTRMTAHVRDAKPETLAAIERNRAVLSRLARLDSIEVMDAPEKGALQVVVDEATYALPLAGVIDLDMERARLAKAIGAAEKERDSLAGRLSNPSFVERAKPEAVEKARADHADKAAEAERLGAALKRLG